MTSYLFRAPAGIAGSVTRVGQTTVEPGQLAASGTPTAFGQPVKVVGGEFALMGAGSAAADFYGVLSRIVPSISGPASDDAPNAEAIAGIVTRGYVNVLCPTGTPARGGAVYVRVAAPGAGQAIGDFEAVADGADTVLLVGVIWASDGKDADNNAELRVAR